MPREQTGSVKFDKKKNVWIARLTYLDELGQVREIRRQVVSKTEGRDLIKKLIREIETHGAQVIDGAKLLFSELATVGC